MKLGLSMFALIVGLALSGTAANAQSAEQQWHMYGYDYSGLSAPSDRNLGDRSYAYSPSLRVRHHDRGFRHFDREW
jgi:hypothetical protein